MLTFFLAVFYNVTGSDEERPFLYYPGSYDPWDMEMSLGLTLAHLPEKVVEEEMDRSPLIDFNVRMGLPYGFSLYGRAGSIYITNHFSVGLLWSYQMGRLGFSAGDDVALWFGDFGFEGFDVSTRGWLNYPYITAGYDFGDFYFSLKTELIIITGQKNEIGGTVVKDISNQIAGIGFTFMFEQAFWNDNHVLVGLKISNTRYFYQSWISYETFNMAMTYPEFIIGFIL